jgi:hypothetical protein
VLLFAVSCSPSDPPANVVLFDWAIPAGHFVSKAARVGDVDRDGIDDLVVGRSAGPVASSEGLASVYSVRTGKEVLRLRTDPSRDFLFEVAASAGDYQAAFAASKVGEKAQLARQEERLLGPAAAAAALDRRAAARACAVQ